MALGKEEVGGDIINDTFGGEHEGLNNSQSRMLKLKDEANITIGERGGCQ